MRIILVLLVEFPDDNHIVALTNDLSLQEFTNMIGVTATDVIDGSVSVSIVSSNVVKSVLGTYSVLYRATDSNNNVHEKYRTVIVKDFITPRFTFNSNEVVSYTITEEYNNSTYNVLTGVQLVDNYDIVSNTEIDLEINGVNVDYTTISLLTTDTYTIKYTYSDNNNNSASLTGIVNVDDTKPPTITLDSSVGNLYTVEYSSTDQYVPPGATADVVDGSISVTIDHSVLLNSVGTYTVSYKATDVNNNVSETLYRTVVVIRYQWANNKSSW